MKEVVGFIGQGWIGNNYANDFDQRGYKTVRYALEEPYRENKERIRECDIVFIAVPTPTKVDGFQLNAVRSALNCLSHGTIAVIKSTLLPGSTESLQAAFPNLIVTHSPEFLREANAAHDAANPKRNIIGIVTDDPTERAAAERVLAVLPRAPFERIMGAREAELVKYAGNCFLYQKVVFMNLLYDLVGAHGADWTATREALVADPRIGNSHTEPIHVSGHLEDVSHHSHSRGAGGHCFIKDFEAFRQQYNALVGNEHGERLLEELIAFNNHLLIDSDKDVDILMDVYGPQVVQRR